MTAAGGSDSDPQDPVFGIDLGTSNSCVALWINGQVDIVRNLQGERTTPSVVAIGADGAIIIGAPARRQAVMNPQSTVSEVKRLVGLRFDSKEVTAARQVLPYEICSATNGDAWTRIGNEERSPQELQAYILEELAAACSQFIGREATRVVITVPAFFDETQRQAVRDAAAIAGLKVERILSEPTAAALAYGYAQFDNRHIAVVDLGGGTLDVTIMKVDGGKFEVLATDGDNSLGGADFDRAIALHFAADIQKNHGVDVREDPVAMQRLLGEAEVAKKLLTQQQATDVKLPYLAQQGSTSIDFEYRITRDEYRNLVAPLVERIAAPCMEAVSLAGLRPTQLDDVILIGGMTRSLVVQERVTELFERKPLLRINPDEAVAMGAALLGAGISGQLDEVTFVDVAPRSIGLRAAGDTFVTLIKKSATLPARCRKGFKTTRDQQQSFELDVFQGESPKASENRRLAHVTIQPISLMPAGEVMLEVQFEVDTQGALVVQAKERGKSEPTRVAIEPFSGLTSAQVQGLAAQHEKNRPKIEFSKAKVEPEMGGFSINIGKAKKTPAPAAVRAPTKPSRASTAAPAARTSSSPVTSRPVTSRPVTSRPLTANDLFGDEGDSTEAVGEASKRISLPKTATASAATSSTKTSSEEATPASDAKDANTATNPLLWVGLAVAVAVAGAVAAFSFL
tara:strand:+ start:4599 stop:6647 length:2049 start_codon:yes stop_codon:yes gene_type:complete